LITFTLIAITEQTESERLFDMKLLNHVVMWSNRHRFTRAANCSSLFN